MSVSYYFLVPLAIITAVLQSSFTSEIHIFGVCPDLVLLLTVAWALIWGSREGYVVALIGGVVLDVFSGAAFGLSTIALLAVSLLASLGETNVFGTAWFLPYITIAAATIVYDSALMLMMGMAGRPLDWWPTLLQVVFPSAILNTLCMPIVQFVIKGLHERIRPRTVELS